MTDWIPADWPAPAQVHAGTTTRLNGLSPRPFGSFNLAAHVGDRSDAVAGNRRQLRARLKLPAEPAWLRQQHGNKVIKVEQGRRAEVDDAYTEADADSAYAAADGAYADSAGEVCAVLTADCVPLLLCDRSGAGVAALHIGWRGLCSRVIKHGLSRFDAAPQNLLAWIGPHIRQENYEVGADVVSACASIWPETRTAITPGRSNTWGRSKISRKFYSDPGNPDRWYLSLAGLVKVELQQLGVTQVYDCGQCTYANKDLFYSYRRDGLTGRMASLIWKVSPSGRPGI